MNDSTDRPAYLFELPDGSWIDPRCVRVVQPAEEYKVNGETLGRPRVIIYYSIHEGHHDSVILYRETFVEAVRDSGKIGHALNGAVAGLAREERDAERVAMTQRVERLQAELYDLKRTSRTTT